MCTRFWFFLSLVWVRGKIFASNWQDYSTIVGGSGKWIKQTTKIKNVWSQLLHEQNLNLRERGTSAVKQREEQENLNENQETLSISLERGEIHSKSQSKKLQFLFYIFILPARRKNVRLSVKVESKLNHWTKSMMRCFHIKKKLLLNRIHGRQWQRS